MYELMIKDAIVVTVDQNDRVLDSGLVVVDKGKIKGIYQTSDPVCRDLRAKTVVAAGGKLLIPGFINMHCHAGDSLFRGLVENLALEEWLSKVWVAEKNILTPQTTYIGSILGLAENLLAGVTTVMDMFWYPEQTAEAAKHLGIRLATGGIFFDPPGVGGRSHEEYIAEAQGFFTKYKTSDRIFPATMPHGTYTVCEKNLQDAKQIADKYAGLFSTHAAETLAEQSDIKSRYGLSVIRHLNKLGLLGEKTVLAHCVHLDETEIKLLADTKTTVVHNPVSNLKLGSGIAPIGRLSEAGVLVTVGTDGAISGNDLDIWMALRLSAILPKGSEKKPDLISAKDALRMVTANGAKALGKERLLGSIEIGKQADFSLIDISTVHATPMFDPITHLVYSTNKSDVSDVFVGGIHLVKQRKIVAYDIEKTLMKVKDMTPEIRRSLLKG